MKLDEHIPLTSRERAEKLGLSSGRFREDEMSENAREEIEYAKRKDRSEMKVEVDVF
jgi:hypothetical protein